MFAGLKVRGLGVFADGFNRKHGDVKVAPTFSKYRDMLKSSEVLKRFSQLSVNLRR